MRLTTSHAGAAKATLCVLAAAMLAGCGSGSSSSTPTAGNGGKPLSFFQSRLNALYKGTFTSPPTTSPTPQPGKNIWVISYGLSSLSGAEYPAGAKEAGSAIGWHVTVFDGKYDSNVELTGIRQAIAAHADGILLYAIDCPAIQAGLIEAKQAGIPVVSSESNDCSDLKAGAPSLFTGDNGFYNAAPYGPPAPYGKGWIQGYAKAAADAIIVHAKGHAKVIDFVETDSEATLREDQGFRQEMALCGGCSIVGTVDFTGVDFGPGLQQKASQALLQHPEADSVWGVYDSPVIAGIAAAVRSSGRQSHLYVVGGEGDPPNVALVQANQGQNSGVGLPVQWEGYSSIDALNRIFNGGTPVPNGIGLQIWDKTHNLTPDGKNYATPLDFKSVYLRAWGVQ